MKYGIADLSIVPVRSEAREQSEQITQILFGETVEITETRKSWYKIISFFDRYEGWVDRKLIKEITKETFDKINNSNKIITNEVISVLYKNKEKYPLLIPAGSSLPVEFGKSNFFIEDDMYKIDTSIENLKLPDVRESIVKIAQLYINAPYLWGGRTPFGIDCSGFSQIIYKIHNINIPRDASQQVLKGKAVDLLFGAKQGDLAFFDNEEGRIIHVGIVLDGGKIIHASGKVRIDKLDHQGIYNEEIGKYTHNLRVIKNIID